MAAFVLPVQVQSSEAISVLVTVSQNILDHPCDERYRRIRVSSSSFQTVCGAFGGEAAAVDFFTSRLGFEPCEDPVKGKCLVLAPSTTLDGLRNCLLAAENRRGELEARRRAAVEKELAQRHAEAIRQRDQAALVFARQQQSSQLGASQLASKILAALSAGTMSDADWKLMRDAGGEADNLICTQEKLKRLLTTDVREISRDLWGDVVPLVDAGIFERETERRQRARQLLQEADRTARRAHDKETAPTANTTVPRELILTATQLVNDIASLMEQCETLTNTSGLVRKDRLRARELLASVSAGNVEIEALHDMKSEWVRRLEDVKKSLGRATVFLQP